MIYSTTHSELVDIVRDRRPDYYKVFLDEEGKYALSNVAWVAGLLEGEGSFTSAKSKSKNIVDYRIPMISVRMTDEDVIQRVAALWQRCVSSKLPQAEGYLKQYGVRYHGTRAIAFMMLIYPYMGKRRRAKIFEVVAAQLERQRFTHVKVISDLSNACAFLSNGLSALELLAAKRPALAAQVKALSDAWGEDSVAWLAGLLEGEGSFLTSKAGTYKGAQYYAPLMTLAMTDEDVVERASVFFGRKVYKIEKKNPRWSPVYALRVSGENAIVRMCAIYPFMGKRRREKILEVVEVYMAKLPLNERRRQAALRQHARGGFAKIEVVKNG